jgi:hypothetical protein
VTKGVRQTAELSEFLRNGAQVRSLSVARRFVTPMLLTLVQPQGALPQTPRVIQMSY